MAGRYDKEKVSELKRLIKKQTAIVNKQIKNVREKGTDISNLESNISKLKTLGARGRGGNEVGLGFRGKSKAELVRQLRELEYFSAIGIDTEAGQLEFEEKFQKSYESFRQSYDINKEDYRELVETFGAVGSEIVSKYDSFTVAEAYSERGKNINLAKLMKETINEHKNEGLNQKELTDILIDKMRSEV